MHGCTARSTAVPPTGLNHLFSRLPPPYSGLTPTHLLSFSSTAMFERYPPSSGGDSVVHGCMVFSWKDSATVPTRRLSRWGGSREVSAHIQTRMYIFAQQMSYQRDEWDSAAAVAKLLKERLGMLVHWLYMQTLTCKPSHLTVMRGQLHSFHVK